MVTAVATSRPPVVRAVPGGVERLRVAGEAATDENGLRLRESGQRRIRCGAGRDGERRSAQGELAFAAMLLTSVLAGFDGDRPRPGVRRVATRCRCSPTLRRHPRAALRESERSSATHDGAHLAWGQSAVAREGGRRGRPAKSAERSRMPASGRHSTAITTRSSERLPCSHSRDTSHRAEPRSAQMYMLAGTPAAVSAGSSADRGKAVRSVPGRAGAVERRAMSAPARSPSRVRRSPARSTVTSASGHPSRAAARADAGDGTAALASPIGRQHPGESGADPVQHRVAGCQQAQACLGSPSASRAGASGDGNSSRRSAATTSRGTRSSCRALPISIEAPSTARLRRPTEPDPPVGADSHHGDHPTAPGGTNGSPSGTPSAISAGAPLPRRSPP